MATQKVRPDPGILERQDRRQRRRSTGRKVGTYGLVAVVVVVVTAAAVAVWRSEPTRDAATLGRPSATGPAVNGPAVNGSTEPSATGPAVTGPTKSSNDRPVGFSRFLSKGAEPSAPEHGKHGTLVVSDSGIGPWYAFHVYADGRVLWGARTGGASTTTPGWLERRLTPKGIGLLRSGAVFIGGPDSDPWSVLPASAWEDPEFERFVPSRYAVCPNHAPAAKVWRLLPRQARDLLRGNEQGYIQRCLAVTTAEARVLHEIFLGVGFERSRDFGQVTYRLDEPEDTEIIFLPVLPNATFKGCCLG